MLLQFITTAGVLHVLPPRDCLHDLLCAPTIGYLLKSTLLSQRLPTCPHLGAGKEIATLETGLAWQSESVTLAICLGYVSNLAWQHAKA